MQIALDLGALSKVVVARRSGASWVLTNRSGDARVRVKPELGCLPEAIADQAERATGAATDAALLQYLRFYFLQEGRLGRHIRYDDLLMDGEARHRPEHISLILTKVCNFSCVHCYNDSGHRHPNELRPDEKLDLVDYMGRWGVPNLILSGGEPTLDPVLASILACAGRYRMAVKITTNAWRIPDALLEAVAANIVQQVNVSLDASIPTRHDQFRAKIGSFHRVIEGMAQLKRVGIRKLVVNSSISSGQVGDMEALARLSLEHGAAQISFKAVLQSGRKGPGAQSSVLNDNEKAQFQKERERLKLVFRSQLSIEGGLITDEVPDELLDDVTCNAATTAMMIDADGSMMPCEIVAPFVTAPNIRSYAPAQAWAGSGLFNRFRQLKIEYAGGCGTKGCPGCAMATRNDPESAQ